MLAETLMMTAFHVGETVLVTSRQLLLTEAITCIRAIVNVIHFTCVKVTCHNKQPANLQM